MSNEKYIYSYLFYSMFPGTGTLVFVDDQRLTNSRFVDFTCFYNNFDC